MFAALSNLPDNPKFDIPAVKFIRQWRRHPEQLQPLEAPYKNNVDSLIRLRELKKQGKLTDDIRSRAFQELLKHTVPTTTPAGLELSRDLKLGYIAQSKVDSIPTYAIEDAMSEHEWDAQGGADRNTLIDKFHMIPALPYVDEIVSDDRFFHRIYPFATGTGHVHAKLIRNEEFLKRI